MGQKSPHIGSNSDPSEPPSHLIRSGSAAGGPMPEVEKAGSGNLVLLQAGSDSAPFFLVHGLGGGVHDYTELARLLTPELTTYGLKARGLEDGLPPHTTISEIAAFDLELMRSVQSHGPYFLGGYSHGGVVAYEIACQLEKMNEQVGLVAVIDASFPGEWFKRRPFWHPIRFVRFVTNLPFWVHDFLQLDRNEMKTVIVRRLKRTLEVLAILLHLKYRMNNLDRLGEPVKKYPEPLQQVMLANRVALDEFVPDIYNGRVTFFRVRAQPLFADKDRDFGWGLMAKGGADVVIVPGSHHNLLQLPHVKGLALLLKDRLTRARDQM